MSPLWRDQLRIVLCPDRVVIVRLRKGWWPSIADKHILPCNPVTGEPAWRAPLDVLANWLSEAKPKKANVEVVLSNHYVRYAIVPWIAALNHAEEEQTFTRIHFQKIYGDMAKQWALRISDASYQSPRLASAIDQGLLDALFKLFTKTTLRLTSIQPYLMTAFNQWRQRLRKQNGVFALIEPGKVCFARISAGKWLDIKSVLLQDSAEEWQELLKREMLLGGYDANTKIYLHVIEQPALDLKHIESLSVEMLKAPAFADVSPHIHAQFGMALSGIT